jgi:MFS family permease
MNLNNLKLFESLKYRNFKLYFLGQCVSMVGSWIQQIAMGWLVYRLTGSVTLLGLIVFLSQFPTFIITPFVSILIDKISKKSILIFTQAFFMLHALVLTILVLTSIINSSNVWIVLVLSLLFGIVNALDGPTRQAFYTSLVPKEMLTNAIALNSAVINGSRLIGPAIGGVVIGLFGEGICFLIDTISFLFVILALLKIKLPKIETIAMKIHLIKDIKEGLNYIYQRLPIKVLLFITFTVSFFIFPITSFLPAYVKDTLGGGSEMLGSLMSFLGIGSFSGALILASRKSIVGLEKIQQIGVLGASLSLVPFFFITNSVLAHILIIIIGFSMVIAIASTNTMIQALTHNYMKGRVMGYYTICFIGGSSLGNLVIGWVSKLYDLQIIIAFCGVLCLLLVLLFFPYRKEISIQQNKIYSEHGIIPEIVEGISKSDIKP